MTDMDALKKLSAPRVQAHVGRVGESLDDRELTAYVMRSMGATFEDIGRAFGVSRQAADAIYKRAEAKAQRAGGDNQ